MWEIEEKRAQIPRQEKEINMHRARAGKRKSGDEGAGASRRWQPEHRSGAHSPLLPRTLASTPS